MSEHYYSLPLKLTHGVFKYFRKFDKLYPILVSKLKFSVYIFQNSIFKNNPRVAFKGRLWQLVGT